MIKLPKNDPRLRNAKQSLKNYSSNLLKFGMSDDPKNYSEEELLEIVNGIYRKKKKLLVRGDYFIDVDDIVSTECDLARVTYKKGKLSSKDYENGYHKSLRNISNFHINDYFVITKSEYVGKNKHNITKHLFNTGLISRSRGKYPKVFAVKNDYESLQNNKFPKDLFHPIKRFINRYFFDNDYHFPDFKVTGYEIEFEN
ncbi:hypothetical protein PZ892_10490 [Sphingobacterium sp. WM]|uniref:hypothetical protein n=1 Tax=Sphingobacterium sp. WM TaxID=3031802 RepID=UPI00240E40DA|nr:hypothetical protein [Sphingobacterium sp. WM]WFB62109.1 hypothetical protein PZ892_10490 [Sphingobacterium sp. WM]